MIIIISDELARWNNWIVPINELELIGLSHVGYEVYKPGTGMTMLSKQQQNYALFISS